MARRALATLSILLPLLATGQVRLSDLERGLVASYPLDGDAVDEVGRARAGAFGTRPLEDRSGGRNGALWFDGARSHVNLGASLQPERFTLSAWVRPESLDRVQVVVSKVRNLPGHYQKNLELRIEAGGRLFLHVPSGAGWESATGLRPIPAMRWTHVAAVYDGARAQLYVDGAPDGAPLAVAYAQSPTDTFLGARPEGGGQGGRTAGPTFYFHGGLDDVRIWDRALSGEELAVVAGRAAPAPEPPQAGPPRPGFPMPFPLPIAAYPLDGDAREAMGGADGAIAGGLRPAEDRQGDPRGALSFDGRGRVDLGVRTEPERFTLAVWLRAARGDRRQVIFSKATSARSARQKWLELETDPFGRVVLSVPNASPFRYQVTSTPRLPSGRWVHLAATYDGDTATLYLDGAPAGQAKVEPFDASPGPVMLGARPDAPGRPGRGTPFDGRMDDLRIYRGALSAEEVAAVARGLPYQPPAPPGPPPRRDDDEDDASDALLVQAGKLVVRYDAALVRRDPRRIAKAEERIVRELSEAARDARGDRETVELLRYTAREFERSRGAQDAMSLDRKRSALVALSESLWNDLARELDAGPAPFPPQGPPPGPPGPPPPPARPGW